MSVVLSNSEVGPCRRELKIEVPAPAVDAEWQRVLSEYKKKVRIPGFRPGKAPTELLERRYRGEIENEVADRLVPRYWRQAQAETNLEPLLTPRVSALELVSGQPLTFVATVEVKPAIELRNVRDFELPPHETEPTTDEITSYLDELRRARAPWVAADREGVKGDLVVGEMVELTTGADGETVAGEARPVQFEIGHPRVWESLSLAATGAKAGREVEFVHRHEGGDAEHAHEHRHRLRVDEIREQQLPALDDDLARQLGAESLEQMHKEVEARLRMAKGDSSRRRRESAVVGQLIERHPMALPEWVVEEEVRGLLYDYAETLARQGVDVEHANLDWEALGRDFKPQAERQVHARLLLDAVAEQEGIKVPESEFESTISLLARSQGKAPLALRRELDEAGKLASLRAQMRRQRVLRVLLGEPESQGDDAVTLEASQP